MSELRSAAVMFADIAAATELRNSLGDRQADAILDPLLQALTEIVHRNGGDVLKSDGDDVLAVFDRPQTYVDDAANAAMECQLAARGAGRKLYVGLDAGVVEFREVLGRPDVAGMPVNLAARLHKLVPDLAGYIFLAADTVQSLRAELRDRARPYGVRPIKGVGAINVHTLDWDEAATVVPTRFALPATQAIQQAIVLGLTHAGRVMRLAPESPPLMVGRDRNNELRIDDDEQRVSSRHLKVLCRNGAWILQDTSRNGTWVRFNNNSNQIGLLGDELKLVGNGRMCLGRPFADDVQGRFTVHFELVKK